MRMKRKPAKLSQRRIEYLKYRKAKAAERLVNCEVRDFTQKQWFAVLKQFDYSCAYCGKTHTRGGRRVRLTRDHVIPLAHGGNHTMENIVPACRSCNSSKGKLSLEEWFGVLERNQEVASKKRMATTGCTSVQEWLVESD